MERLDGQAISGELLRALVENAADLISLVDAAGTVRYEAPAAQRVLGYTPEELTGCGVLDLVHPDDRQRAGEQFQELVRCPGGTTTSKLRYRHKDGSWRTLEVVARNLLHNPRVAGIVINSRDVTEREVLEAQLEESRRLASVGRLVSSIAHEMNNLLMGIQPVADLLSRSGDDPRLARLAGLLQTSIDRGRHITGDLLGFGRRAPLKACPVWVADWIRLFSEEVRPLLGHVALVTEVEDGLTILAAPLQLHQVMLNLVINARDAMDGAGTLRITAARAVPGDRYYPLLDSRGQSFARICVSDTGPGIPPHIRERIFEPFFTTKTSGGGLGLWLVHQMMQVQGGLVAAESEPGRGATMTLFFREAVAQEECAPVAADAR